MVYLQEHLLGHIFSLSATLHEAVYQIHDPLLMTLNQRFKAGVMPRLNSKHQLIVVHFSRLK
jgi:hypothetical protein